MLYIQGQLCYSPYPLEDYGSRGVGHGLACGGDIQLWNLMYLSTPDLDKYIMVNARADVIFKSIGIDTFACAKAMLYGQSCQQFFPHLRQALRLPPRHFYDQLLAMDWKLMPYTQKQSDWIFSVAERIAEIEEMYSPILRDTQLVLDNIRKGTIT